MRSRLYTLALAASLTLTAAAVDYDSCFADSTLRLDYSFAHSPGAGAAIYYQQAEVTPGWAGRRHHLPELALRGNGALIMTDAATGDTIYATSFTTLFHEWLATDEARTTPRSFGYTFLVPKPHRPADLHISLIDARQQVMAEATHRYDPADILVRRWRGTPAPHTYLHRGGDPAEAIDVAIVGDGYREEELATLVDDARRATEAILGHEPFKSHSQQFNFVVVPLASADSDVSHPNRPEWNDTRYSCHYSTLYSDRYMTTPAASRAHDDLRGIPYEHIIIMANTEQYGGGGFYNVITTAAAHHPTMPNVVTHEFGHSFGGLADEYFYPGEQLSDIYTPGVEPWERNITNLTDFDSKPWSHMIPAGTPRPTPVEQAADCPVGLYEGGGYVERGMYRPADRCRMRTNDYPDFCPVCTAALEELIDFYTK